jgi:hypothetical protein
MSLHNFGTSLKHPALWNSGCRQANEAREHHFTPEAKQPRKTFGPLKPHFKDFRFHNNQEVEMAIREWLHMQKNDF